MHDSERAVYGGWIPNDQILISGIIVPDQVGTLAQDGTSPDMGWRNKEPRTPPAQAKNFLIGLGSILTCRNPPISSSKRD